MTWSHWQVPPFATSVFFILGVFTLYWVTFNWLTSWAHTRHLKVSDDTLNNIYGIFYMLVFVFSIQTLVVGGADAWQFMNFQMMGIVFCAYFLNIHMPYYYFIPIVLVYMVFDGSYTYWQSWGHALTLMGFFWALNVIRVKFHDHKLAATAYMLVGTAFGGPLWLWMKFKFQLSWSTFWQEWLYLVIFEALLYVYVSMIVHDSELKLKLAKFASHDALTQSGNFAAYMDEVQYLFRDSRKHHQPFSMVMFDIDHFKHVNDTYGHSVGDQVLRQVAAVAQTVIAENDSEIKFYRTGGEEFNILFPRYKIADANQVAEQIFSAVNHLEIKAGDETIHVSISVGVSAAVATDQTSIDFYNRVDHNLYHSKQNGRMQITVA